MVCRQAAARIGILLGGQMRRGLLSMRPNPWLAVQLCVPSGYPLYYY
jgi:hypothetical protein